MRITVDLIDPLSKKKMKKSFILRGKKNKNYAERLLKMADNGMIMIPVNLTLDIDGTEYEHTVMFSTSATPPGHRGAINQHSVKTVAPRVDISGSYKEEHISWWKRILGMSDE